jgi:uncharacterized protein (DUF4415 family)
MAIIRREIPQPQPKKKAAVPDSEPVSQELYEELAKMASKKREERRKQVLTLRVSTETMQKAKALGKGYTGILSRLLEEALNDPDMIERCL